MSTRIVLIGAGSAMFGLGTLGDVLKCQALEGSTVVLHDINLAARYADRILLLDQGRVRAIGDPEAVLTEESLGAVYGYPVRVVAHPDLGSPLVLPLGGGDGDRASS